MDSIRRFFAQKFNISTSKGDELKGKVIEDLNLDGLIKHWNEKGFTKIITMVGAGISTSAGIPDFRSPGSGLYDNLQKYDLPYPMAIFDIDFFGVNPKPFFSLAKELYPGNFNPTPSHFFVKLLHEKGLLQRHYTQNIDTLERIAGIPEEKLVEAHGTFYTNHCQVCHKAYSKEWVKESVFKDKVPKCTKCKGVIKPDIVFFGENLPDRFYIMPERDFSDCDLLIIMGTSLEVYPFASLLENASPSTLRLLINRTKVGGLSEDERNTRDIIYLGDCDDAVWEICKGLGWTKELQQLIERENALLEVKYGETRRQRNSSTSSVDEPTAKEYDLKDDKSTDEDEENKEDNKTAATTSKND